MPIPIVLTTPPATYHRSPSLPGPVRYLDARLGAGGAFEDLAEADGYLAELPEFEHAAAVPGCAHQQLAAVLLVQVAQTGHRLHARVGLGAAVQVNAGQLLHLGGQL